MNSDKCAEWGWGGVRTCHILPPSEVDLGLCLAAFAGSEGNIYFTELAGRVEYGNYGVPCGPRLSRGNQGGPKEWGSEARTVDFHNFNLRIFNLRVSNPNNLIVGVFLTRRRISMCQGLGPKKHDEISEIDRI